MHSTETTHTRVHSNIMRAVNTQGGAILVLLDLSAAFDTIDHNLLLDTLGNKMGVSGTALQWFHSYLTNRYQIVSVCGSCSKRHALLCGVPQGSVLGPLLFSSYTTPLCSLVVNYGLDKDMYATQMIPN